MNITPELLKTIRSSYENGWSDKKDFDVYLCDEIKRLKDIKNRIYYLNIDIEKKEVVGMNLLHIIQTLLAIMIVICLVIFVGKRLKDYKDLND